VKPVIHLSVSIQCAAQQVYDFASNPANLPLWAAGLTQAELVQDGDIWIAQAPFGQARIRFAERNAYGVMDHSVEMDDGQVVYNPLRVVPNGDGSECTFTLFRRDDMDDQQFQADHDAVVADLQTLKRHLESRY
tara:strand:- start:351 stop:752 length:402 start_codon:yes stop_codon:yes gene_type:complete